MGKSGKSGGKSAGTAGKKPQAVKEKPVQSGNVTEAVKEDSVQEMAVQVEATKEKKAFDLPAYLKSYAWVYPLALILIMVLMFYIRAVPSYGAVFTGWPENYVNIAADDAPEQMRLVFNTLANFPNRIFFDPFTHYPFGSTVHFGPFFTLMIAGASLIVGLGNPSPETVTMVGAYTPVILGMLCAIPTYFMGKKLYGRNVGILAAATLALLPGQFLGRSMLGFTDHHVAEVLFSVVTVAFLVYALENAKTSGLNLEKIKSRNKDALIALGFAALAGVSFGLYMLSWPGGLLVGFILFLYFAIQAVVDHTRDTRMDYLVIVAAAMYLIPSVMVLPYSLQDLSFQLLYYSITQPVFLSLAFVGIGVIYGLSRVLKSNKVEAWAFPATMLGVGVIGLLGTYVVFPQLFELIMSGFKVFAPSGGMLWVQEARPSYLTATGEFTLDMLWGSFFWTFWLSIISIVVLAFRVFKNNRPAEWLFLVWNVVMLWAAFTQIRFTYYFAINAALLTAYFVYAVYRAFDWDKFVENWQKRVSSFEDAQRFIGKNSGQVIMFGVLAVVFLVLITWPATSLSTGAYRSIDPAKDPAGFFFTGYTEAYSQGGSGMGYEWYDALLWLRDHTPDPQGPNLYYNGTYVRSGGDRYDYPSSAYGVMSWWDYGHVITYVAHRIPNANPFQAGINEANNTGSAPFFLATTEEKGYANLKALGSEYVVIDNEMATGKFYAITVWADDKNGWETEKEFPISATQSVPLPVDSKKYADSMMSRLYYDDADSMDHFRLVYESAGDYQIRVRLLDTTTGTINSAAQIGMANYTEAYDMYTQAIDLVRASSDGTMLAYDARPPAKYVKVYEVVDGAKITGKADPGTNVTASLPLTIGGRSFTYTQSGIADSAGSFTLTVPYATEAMNGTSYSSAVTPAGKYTLTLGNSTSQVDVPERAVQSGETINV
ncbi:oligosaccharyl transferase, archaeosortase A system-associated [Methanocella sp. MCL-LM]|uniref:oligosaccharyl transferase, archaeosortase A system-associated n=1 Tax=Methanocella sp. MCL-LM TaxID=3412035 RepID=UPI003C76B69A